VAFWLNMEHNKKKYKPSTYTYRAYDKLLYNPFIRTQPKNHYLGFERS
jgi:hypothetical protein